jgi:pyruvate formate lyase activating enzyme
MIPPVKGFIKNTLLDWDGKVASVIFLPGCTFLCPMCHSPHLVRRQDELETVPINSVVDFIESNRDWIDGLVITGGEPTMQPGIIDLLEMLKHHGIPVKLDTNGSRPEVLGDILTKRLIAAVAMDVKAPKEKYSAVAGVEVDVASIDRSIRLIMESDIEYEFRTTVCPTMHTGEDVEEIARWIAGARRYVLQNFRPKGCLDPAMEKVAPYTIAQLQGFAERARKHVPSCVVRGYEALQRRYA